MAEAAETTMDYAAHERTFTTFIHMVKFSMAALALGVVALYSFVIAGNFWAGLLFLVLAVPAGLFAGGFLGRKR